MVNRSHVLLTLACALAGSANAQFVQQGGKLVAAGAVGNANQGSSAALSADGNTALVGGPYDSGGAGAAWVFTRSGGAWTQQGSKLVGTGAMNGQYGAQQGTSVALSADGNTAIVGGSGDNSGTGAAWVYTRSGGAWTQQGSKLVGSGAVGNAAQGYSVALSADGSTAIVGGPCDNGVYCSLAAGAAWVYTRSGVVWTQQGSKLVVGTGAVGSRGGGSTVALSADGSTAIVGVYADNSGFAAAFVYTRSGGVWNRQGGPLMGADRFQRGLVILPEEQKSPVALSADSNTAIVGGPFDNVSAGAAWVYMRSGGVWTQQGSKLVGTGAVGNADQGLAVALSGDGNKAIVGGGSDNTNHQQGGATGAAWLYTRSGGVWTQQGSKLVGTGAVGLAEQGASVALSGDGNTAIIGGAFDNGGIGAAWVFVFAPGAPTVTSSAATSITGSGATLGGNVNPNGSDTQVWFLYSTDSSMSGAVSTAHQDIGSGTVAVPVSANITGLAPETTYYFQVAAQNNAATVLGSALSFATSTGPPSVSTSLATSITNSGAILGGRVSPNGLDTHVWFLYSTSSSMSGALPTPQQDIGLGTTTVPVSSSITGLAINTTYYFQAVAQNSMGTTQGSILSFATTIYPPPSVSTSAATSITSSSATLGGNVNPNGSDTQVWFLYSTNSSMSGALSTAHQDIGSGTAAVPVSANITGLAINTTYYFQVVAQNSGVISQGLVLSFATPSAINIGGVANGFSFQQGFAPGMILSIFGVNLANSTQLESTAPLPVLVAGVSVTINGIPAPFYYLSPGQLNVQIPYATAVGTAMLAVNNNGQVATTTFNVSAAAPGISVTSAGMLNPNTSASGGQSLGLFITGAGGVSPAVSDGTTPSGVTPVPVLPVSVTVGGVVCPLLYAGIPSWSVGVTQINFTVPQNVPVGTQAVVVTVGGVASPPAKITIQ